MITLKKAIKPLKTIEEDRKGKNLKSINTKTKRITKNPILIEETKKWIHPWYEVIMPKRKKEFIRSKRDGKKTNNLDPKIKVLPKKKIDKSK